VFRNRRITSTVAGVATLAATAGLLFASAGAASATTYTYEPDPFSIGTLTFYDANGHVITSGTLPSDPNAGQAIAAYTVGTHTTHATGDTFAVLVYATPTTSNDTSTWTTQQANSKTDYTTLTGKPAPLNNTTLPIVQGRSTDETLTTAADRGQGVTNVTTGANANIYQLRMYTNSRTSGAVPSYDSADILLDSTAHTWTQMYPTVTNTTTTLTATATGASETLDATVTPATVPGTVTFFDGTTQVGQPVPVINGTASAITPAVGNHSYTARFDPTPGYSDGATGTANNPPSATLNEYKDSTSTPQTVGGTPPPALPEAPEAVLLLLAGIAVAGTALAVRKRATS